MSESRHCKLGDICRFQAGDAFKKELQGRESGDFPFIKVSDMNRLGNEYYIRHAANWVTSEIVETKGFRLHQPGSVVFAKIGVALTYNRRRILTRPTSIDNNMMSATPDEQAANPRYFYYLLSTIDFNEIASGTALPYLTVKDLSAIPICLPSMRDQEELAELLGSLDDRIDLNRRMNETLEAMARAIFKDWFVDFGPTRAKVEGRAPYLAPEVWDLFPDALDDDDKPVGWNTCVLGNICKFSGGSAFKKDYQGVKLDDYPFIKVKDMNHDWNHLFMTHADNWISQDVRKKIKAKLHERGSIVLAKIGVALTYNRLRILERDTAIDNNLLSVLTTEPNVNKFVLYLILSQFDFNFYAKGSALPYLNISDLQKIPIIKPPESLWRLIGELASPIFEGIRANVNQGKSLAQTRDLLLPKPMSGEIRLSNAENAVGQVT